jgi:mRNA interferase MazF
VASLDLPRGAVITIAGGTSEFGSKPRPAILLQATALFAGEVPLPVCPVTSTAIPVEAPLLRIPVPANAATGLLVPSWAAIDAVQTIRRRRVGEHIGRVDAAILQAIDRALMVFLGIAGQSELAQGATMKRLRSPTTSAR